MSFWRQVIFIIIWLTGFHTAVIGQEWKSVKGTKLYGISGMALIDQKENRTRFLIIHDNKQPSEPRIAILTEIPGMPPQYELIAWPGNDPPVDAEAVSAIPDRDLEFVIAASNGKLFHIKLDLAEKKVRMIKTFGLPQMDPEDNYEGLSIKKLQGMTVAIWGHRGGTHHPGIVYWSLFDPVTYTFTNTGYDSISVPWPSEGVRHITDLSMTPSGILYILSSSDNGDDGPFNSVLYSAGYFRAENKKILFTKNSSPLRIMTFEYHKVEAMEFIPDSDRGMIFGSDDENFGGWIYTTR